MSILESLKHESIKDVVGILDTAFLQSHELSPQYRAMQIANRAFLAHTAIEKGLKSRLEKGNVPYPNRGQEGHDLRRLYRLTKKVSDGQWADALSNAFSDAVLFYEYDVGMLPYLETLETYLEQVGSSKNFTDMRYWLEDASAVEEAVERILCVRLDLHREILEALWSLVGFDRERLASQRVEREVQRALELEYVYEAGTPKGQTYDDLIQWLRTKPNYRHALREAVQRNYAIGEISKLGRARLREAFERLGRSDNPAFDSAPSADPAVAFYMATCQELPSNYPSPYPDVRVLINWKNESETLAEVLSPGGDMLALMTKHVQSRWHINTLSGHGGGFSKSFESGLNWIVSRWCKQVTIVADRQGWHAAHLFRGFAPAHSQHGEQFIHCRIRRTPGVRIELLGRGSWLADRTASDHCPGG